MNVVKVNTFIGAVAITVALSTPASADLIYLGPTNILGTGIGNQQTLISFGAQGNTNSPAAAIYRDAPGTDVIDAEANTTVAGGSNNQTRTLAAAGITSAEEFALIWNVNEPGNDPGVNLDPSTLAVTFYRNNGDPLHVATYQGAVSLFPQVSTGVGGQGHVFILDALQLASVNALIAANGTGNIRVGLGNGITNTRVSLQNEGGAFETFAIGRYVADNVTPSPVPEPTSLVLLGTGLLYGVNRMRKRA